MPELEDDYFITGGEGYHFAVFFAEKVPGALDEGERAVHLGDGHLGFALVNERSFLPPIQLEVIGKLSYYF